MAKRDHSAFDAAVLEALNAARRDCATYVVRNWMERASRPPTCAPVLAALRRLEKAGKVRLAARQPYARKLSWEMAEP
ncbi:hypothetical protein GXW78_11890 [Roseomonas terrae]|uniref:LexA repressor DNA-binding domain-containing protein n=1 Tax=Neoroseomonas terrae TaxID=424799 RepID=A0ABS5EI91_9PROT|nr:hypothetical protein [Neoroseomonas terrae]MBR0650367.1 hypothetical protein [Neoroseomonas terrae]